MANPAFDNSTTRAWADVCLFAHLSEQKPHDLRSAEVLDPDQFKIEENGTLRSIKIDEETDFAPRGKNRPWIFTSANGVIGRYLAALVFPLAYGGLHLSAWNFEFPTAVEGLLWKISGIVIASFALPYATLVVMSPADSWTPDWAPFLVRVLPAVALAGCRVYIVVEAFVSLRAVPIGVYWTPAWVQMIPHL